MDKKMKCVNTMTTVEFKEFFDSFDTVLCDCDDVLWCHRDAISGSPEVINKFKELGKRTYFITNNSINSRDDLFTKFQELGFNVKYDEIFGSAYIAALYIDGLHLPKDKLVYIIGGSGMAKELEDLDIKCFGVGPDVLFSGVPALVESLKERQLRNVAAVLVGFDEFFSFSKIAKAASFLIDPDVHFVATNPDERNLIAPNVLIPGSGAFVNAVKTCCNREPFIVGKPSPYITTILTKRTGLDPKRSLMIGDTCSTDILFGYNCGFQTLFVLTGRQTLTDVTRFKASSDPSNWNMVPDYYANRLGDLFNFMT